MYLSNCIILCITFILTYSQDTRIIDFTHTQLLQQTSFTGDHIDKINIFPDSQAEKQYEFPQVCQLQTKLEEGTASTGTEVNIFDVDDHLTTLKEKFLYLLMKAQKIKRSKANIDQIKDHLELNAQKGNVTKFNSELHQLAQKEDQLSIIKGKIEQLTFKLAEIIKEYNKNPENQQFKEAALNFQIYFNQAKIDYLIQLKDKTKRKIQGQEHERVNYTDFFKNLENKFNQQSELIVQIDHILANFSDINYLKSKIAGHQSKIYALNLYIEEKENCIIQKEKARKKNSNEEIKETMEKLRQKKKEFGNTTNKYCEGVAKKLQNQIQKLLKVFNLTYSCAEGLKDLQDDREKELRELQIVKDKVKLIEDQGFDEYRRKYNTSRDDIKFQLQKIKSFTISQYVHNVSQIDDLIENAQLAKNKAQQELINLPKGDKNSNNQIEIRNLVDKIKLQKAKYCEKYEKYEKFQHRIWKRVEDFQQRERFSAKMRHIYIEQFTRLRTLEEEFKKSSQDIIAILEK